MIKTVLHSDIKDVSVWSFMRVLIDKDFSALVKKKGILRAKKNEYESCWINLQGQYSEILDSEESKVTLSMLIERFTLLQSLSVAQMLIDSLTQNYNQKIVEVLKRIEPRIAIKKETFLSDLENLVNLLKTRVLRLKELEKELEKESMSEDTKYEDFIELLSILSKHQGYRVDPKKTTVPEYLILIKTYKKWLTAKKSRK